MGKQTPNKTKRTYTPEYKADVVRVWKESGESILAVAKRLGISDSSLGKWVGHISGLELERVAG